MQEKFTVMKTFKNENTQGEKVYLYAYQVIKDNEKNRYSIGISLKNGSENNIDSVVFNIFYKEKGIDITENYRASFEGENKSKTISFNIIIEKDEIEDFEISLGEVSYVVNGDASAENEETEAEKKNGIREVPIPYDDIPRLEKSEEKQRGNRKGIVFIAIAVVVMVCIALGILFLFPDEDNDGKGINKVIGRGDEQVTVEEITNTEDVTLSVDVVSAVKDKGINKVSVGKALKQEPPQGLKIFLNGKFYLKGKMYEQSNKQTEDIVLALEGSDYYYSEKVEGRELVQCKINGKDYIIDPVGKTYITVTTAVMNTLGKTPDDFNLKIFNQSIRSGYVLREAFINGEKGLFMRVNYLDGFYDDIYYLKGKVVQINAFNNAGILTQSFVVSEFKESTPKALADISNLTANEDFTLFFTPYIEA